MSNSACRVLAINIKMNLSQEKGHALNVSLIIF